MKLIKSVLTIACLVSGSVAADVVDFEDVIPNEIPATPFVSGGLLFESDFVENAVFTPDILIGANNGTQSFAWCGSNCGDLQIITVSEEQGQLFDLTSIDAGNLVPSGFGAPGEWVPGMTVKVVGFFESGDSISQSLEIDENVFGTYELIGFAGLTHVEIEAPPVLQDGPGPVGNPDAVIDNLVWNVNAIPEPGVTSIASLILVGCVFRRRRG